MQYFNGTPNYKYTYNVKTKIIHLHTMGAINIDLQFEKSFKKTYCQLGSVSIINGKDNSVAKYVTTPCNSFIRSSFIFSR